MSEPVVLVAREGGVATLTLNRPQALNALNRDLTLELREAVFSLENDESVRCLVLRGGEHFMAGGDLKWFQELIKGGEPGALRVQFEAFIHEVHPVIVSLRRMPKPVLASVRGAAAGFGLSLLMACDLAIAADSAYFTLAYSTIGVTPDGGSTFALPRIVGQKKAMEMALLGERFDAATAERLGIVNRVVPAASLEAETIKTANRLAAGPTAVYARTKTLLNASLNATLESQLQREAEAFARSASEPDFQEGLAAFIGKRKPAFKGR
ncbi:MAG TPA: enoyl-CoA hydratase [Burkholderiales bacterium]|nr:enoyl-CoA hydratase [Burkholderiales bacterium]